MSSSQDQFLSEKNETMLQRLLYNDVVRRTGGDLTEKEATRLVKTVKHYMTEVYRVQGPGKPVQALNKEVLSVTLPDYLMYLERAQRGSGRSVMSDMQEEVPLPNEAPRVVRAIEDRRETMDVSSAFAQLQNQRQEGRPKPPPVQDFRDSFKEDGPVPMDVFEKIKQAREEEAKRQALFQQQHSSASQGQENYALSTEIFSQDRRRMQEEAELAFAERERRRLEQRANAGNQLTNALPVPPDMRAVFMGDTMQIGRTLNQLLDQSPNDLPLVLQDKNSVAVVPKNNAAGNPTLAQPNPLVEPRGTFAQQMIITKEPEHMKYKENELNLFVYSADRDWITKSNETRYNFSVTFDPANLPTGLRLSPTSTAKFRNIVRIELVKAIMPGESLDSLNTRSYSSGSFTYSSPYNINLLSFPYIQVRVPELDNNNYGTNQGLNAAFGVLQYDANWIYDTTNTNQRGYFAMIPKFLKCQKTYHPTPLATINKLTFRFERPDGTTLSTIPDVFDIAQVYSSKEVAATAGFPYGYDSAVENGTSAAYYFIKTSLYFDQRALTIGDRILMKNLSWATAPAGSATAQLATFLEYIQNDGGLYIVDVGYGTSATGGITLGGNSQGYCNFIIVRGKFTDPTLGSTATATLANLADTSTPGSLTANTLSEYLSTNANVTGRILNLSHQVQIALRVITREQDATGILRPDNTY